MKRADVSELHFTTALENVPSILRHGILSHDRAGRIPHCSVALEVVQERRKDKQIPGARRLHEYANLYFDAHNPMLSKVREHNDEVCVLRVDPAVLGLPGVIISDCNASSDWVHFRPAATGLAAIDGQRVYARYWVHSDDPYETMRHKSEKCAEVLVPDCVAARFVLGAYVASEAGLERWKGLGIALTARIRRDMFF